MLAPLLIVVYPFFETLFSMYRRRFLQRRSMTQPDGIHLHTLIYRRLKRGATISRGVGDARRANADTSPYLWLLALVGDRAGGDLVEQSSVLALALLAFILIYLFVYWRIVRSAREVDETRRGGPSRHDSRVPADMFKRAFDLVSALVGLLVFGLPMLAVAAWIKLDSAGAGVLSPGARGPAREGVFASTSSAR